MHRKLRKTSKLASVFFYFMAYKVDTDGENNFTKTVGSESNRLNTTCLSHRKEKIFFILKNVKFIR